MAKPDNRADNAEHLKQSIQDTQQNMNETQQYLAEFGSEINGDEENQLEAKNARRKQAIEGFEEELEDES